MLLQEKDGFEEGLKLRLCRILVLKRFEFLRSESFGEKDETGENWLTFLAEMAPLTAPEVELKVIVAAIEKI